MKLPRRTLGRTGEEVTALGLGGEGVLRTFGREEDAYRVIRAALAAGINYFETARAYSGSEAYLGRMASKATGIRSSSPANPTGAPFKEAMAHLQHYPQESGDGLPGSVAGARYADHGRSGGPRGAGRGAGGLPPCPGTGLGAVHRRHRPPRPGSPAPGPEALRV